jgi:Abnormal spindle-like microcephaly-assoc'd, ASPM-SPD-2-Hydin
MARGHWRWRLAVPAAAVLALGSVPTTVSGAGTLSVPYDFATIQAAISAAASGDTVLVAPGTYPEHIDFLGKAITVTSAAGPATTIIDGGGTGRVITFASQEGRDSVLRGFTIRNGNSSFGNGILSDGSPTIEGNVITGNAICSDGGGIYVSGSPLIRNNLISDNGSPDFGCRGGSGGGIWLEGGSTGSSAQIIDNTITGNQAFWGGAIAMFAAGTPTIAGNVMSGNSSMDQGGAIWSVSNSDALVVQNLIVNNHAGAVGGGMFFEPPDGSPGPLLLNNTFAGNTAMSDGSAVWAGGYFSSSRFVDNVLVGTGEGAVYCDQGYGQPPPLFDHNLAFAPNGGVAFEANCGTVAGSSGNLAADPRFASAGDFHLGAGSPAIDAGSGPDPNLPATDLDGNPRVFGAAVDMGAYEAGPSPAVAAFSPTSVDFGAVPGSSSAVTSVPVTLTNAGGSVLRLVSEQVQTPGRFFSVVADGCAGASLDPGRSCTVQVGFAPLSAGTWTGTLQVTDNVGTQSVPMRGTALAGHTAPSPTSLTFDALRVGRQSKALTVTITNDGNAPLHVGTPAVLGAADFAIVSGRGTPCAGATVNVGAVCTVQVTFRPAAPGTRSATLAIPSDDPTSPASVALTGTGI